jgi:tetratricopeptide (TPR) repeat protein
MKKSTAFIAKALALAALALTAATAWAGGGKEGIPLDEAIEQSAAELAAKLPEGTRVAIVGFSSEHQNLSEYIMDELSGALVDGALVDGKLEVANRRNLEFVYKEVGFQASGEVDENTAVSIGKFMAASHVVFGQLVNAGSSRRYRLAGINVETAVQESSTRLSVRDDRAFRNLVAAVRKSPLVTVAANYGETGTIQPKSAGAFLDRGILFATRGDFEMVIADFTEALTLNTDLSSAYVLRGRALRASVTKVTGVGDNFSSVTTYSTGGKALSSAQREAFDRAIADYTQALRLDPNNAAAYRERGRTYSDNGEQDKAIADYNQAIKLNPNDASAYKDRGIAYTAKGINDRAIEDFSAALRIDPNFAAAYNNRGIAYDNKGMPDRAIEDFNAALRIDPNFAITYYNRGLAYYNSGDRNRAGADWRKALYLDPNNATARNNLEKLRKAGYWE